MISNLAASVTAVLPNYNYARYLPERLDSIFKQGATLGGLIFLDDASDDDSMVVAKPLLARCPVPVSIHRNEVNGGSVFLQWARGVKLAETPFIWIAEADDGALPGMLEALAGRLSDDLGAAFAFSDSISIDAKGKVIDETTKSYASMMGDHILDADIIINGREFVRRCLCPRNLVVSASAVLWRTEALRAALERLNDGLALWHCAGDWRVYSEAAMASERIHYDARAFNLHRRHQSSVTGSLARPRHFAEVVAMHASLRNLLGRDSKQDELMRRHLADLRRAWQLS